MNQFTLSMVKIKAAEGAPPDLQPYSHKLLMPVAACKRCTRIQESNYRHNSCKINQ